MASEGFLRSSERTTTAAVIASKASAHVSPSCTNCGSDGESKHRLRHGDGAIRNCCTSCVLLLHKGMFCSLCYLVHEKPTALGDPSLWLTCSKCQRLCHVKCASDYDLPTSSMFFTCLVCSKPEKLLSNDGEPPSKKLRLSVDQQRMQTSDEKAVAAARIVTLLAVQEAKIARGRARASASVAAKAAARAKAALDAAYRIALEDARWRAEYSKCLPASIAAKNRGTLPSPGQDASKNGREEGTGFVPVLSRSQPYKEQVALGNTTLSTQHYTPKVLQEGGKPLMSYPDASSQGVTFQKPPSVSMQEGADQSKTSGECEVAVVSASPASILDGASSLDGLQLSKLVVRGSTDTVLRGGRVAAKTCISSPLGLAPGGSSGDSSEPSLSKDLLQILDKTQKTEGNTPTSSGKDGLASMDASNA